MSFSERLDEIVPRETERRGCGLDDSVLVSNGAEGNGHLRWFTAPCNPLQGSVSRTSPCSTTGKCIGIVPSLIAARLRVRPQRLCWGKVGIASPTSPTSGSAHRLWQGWGSPPELERSLLPKPGAWAQMPPSPSPGKVLAGTLKDVLKLLILTVSWQHTGKKKDKGESHKLQSWVLAIRSLCQQFNIWSLHLDGQPPGSLEADDPALALLMIPAVAPAAFFRLHRKLRPVWEVLTFSFFFFFFSFYFFFNWYSEK